MRYFPIFVDLQNRDVVVVGGGEEAVRKVRLLRKTSAVIKVIAAELHEELQDVRIIWLGRAYDAALLDGATLVYSADSTLNAQVSADAQAKGIPVNAVDEADISTFIIPSIVDRDPVVVAIGTEGTAPVLGQGIRARIDQMLPIETGLLARTAASLRARVAMTIPQGNRRRAFWQNFFSGEPRDALLSDDAVAFELSIGDALHHDARPPIGRLNIVTLKSNDPDMMTIKDHRVLLEADVIIHDKDVPTAFLEMARRDAVRATSGTSNFNELTAKGLHVVHLKAVPTATIVAFPVREDIRDAFLKAVS